ncbi:MAG: trypsin-like peptidase domain-containing protein [Aureispira sp.]
MRKLFLLLCLCTTTLFAQNNTTTHQTHSNYTPAPVKVGDEFPLQLETAHPYNQAGQHGVVFEQEFYNKHSAYIKLYFEDFDLGPEDYVEISTHNTGESIIYGGKGKIVDQNGTMHSTFWSQALLDERITVRLHAVGGVNNYTGFKISRVAYGYSEARIEALASGKSICGSDDKERIACYSGTTMFNKGKAVCRLLINGSGLCTGWLLGCEGHLMTNNHCIGNASDAANTDFMFNYQYSSCTGSSNASSSVVASSATFIKTSPFSSSGLDYTLVKLPVNPTATYGYLSLSSVAPSVGDRIYIVQHPGGRRKEISVKTDQGGTAGGFSMVNSITTNGIRYFADTEGGSSGSPVLSYASNLVYAIHNTGGCQNGSYGRSDKLIANIGNDMPNCGVDNNGGGGNTGGGCSNGISNFPYNESFNGNIGAWTQNSNDNTNWTVRSGSTPSSNTGPSAAINGSHYIYVESSSPQYPSKSAILTSPCFDFSSLTSSAAITFQYHMYGASMGNLRLQASTDGGSSWATLWTQTGDQGNSWKAASINVGSLAGNSSVQLRLNGTTGSSWQGDMAIDQFSISNGSVSNNCNSSFPYNQNFENTIAGWNQSTADDFNWSLRSGSTPSSNTGPSSAYQGNYYLYMESSAPNYSAKQAILTSNCFNLSGLGNATVSFRYHMYGSNNMGDLKLQVSTGAGWTTIWSKVGNQGNSWQLASVNINSYTSSSSVSFRFLGTTGTTWQGDMAIDAFAITGAPEAATVETVDAAPFLTVGPNPFQTHLNVATNMEGLQQYRLVNIQGQVVQEGLLQGNSIEVGNIARGVYFITFYKEEEQIVRKLIKQ